MHSKLIFCQSGGNSADLINRSSRNREIICLVALLFIAFLVRMMLFSFQGNVYDLLTFGSWIGASTDHGLRTFYDRISWCDYPPFSIYILYGFGNLAKLLGLYNMSRIFDVIKLIPTLFDLATSSIIYIFVRKQASFKLSLVATALYAFNPAVIFNGAIWGQLDAVYTFFIVLSLMLALKSKPKLSVAVLALAILTKPQAIAIAPLIALLIYKKNGLKTLVFSLIIVALTVFVIILPFNWSNPAAFLSHIYLGAYGGFKFTSVNAFNLWGLVGFFVPDGGFFILGWALFGGLTVSVLYFLNKRFDAHDEVFIVFCAFMLVFGFFMLPTRIHERYLFPAISLLVLTFPLLKKTRPVYAVLTGTLLLNLSYVLYFTNNSQSVPSRSWVDIAAIIINILTMAYALVLMVGYAKKNQPKLKRQL